MTDLIIIKRKHPEVIKNKIIVHVYSAHGDNDLTTMESIECNDATEAGNIVDLVVAGHALLKKNRCGENKKLWDELEKIMPDGSEIFSNLVPPDATDNNCYAMPDHIRASWFNLNGEEFIMGIKNPRTNDFVETFYLY